MRKPVRLYVEKEGFSCSDEGSGTLIKTSGEVMSRYEKNMDDFLKIGTENCDK